MFSVNISRSARRGAGGTAVVIAAGVLATLAAQDAAHAVPGPPPHTPHNNVRSAQQRAGGSNAERMARIERLVSQARAMLDAAMPQTPAELRNLDNLSTNDLSGMSTEQLLAFSGQVGGQLESIQPNRPAPPRYQQVRLGTDTPRVLRDIAARLVTEAPETVATVVFGTLGQPGGTRTLFEWTGGNILIYSVDTAKLLGTMNRDTGELAGPIATEAGRHITHFQLLPTAG